MTLRVLNSQEPRPPERRADGSLHVHSVFKPVVGWESLYMVSSVGRVKSLPRVIRRRDGQGYTVRGKELKLTLAATGYPCVYLCNNGKQVWHLVHRLVALAFIPNPDNKREVNHKDGNKANNTVINLEWVTHREQENHAVSTGLKARGSRCARASMDETEVWLIKQELARGDRTKDVSARHRISSSVVSAIRVGRTWRHV